MSETFPNAIYIQLSLPSKTLKTKYIQKNFAKTTWLREKASQTTIRCKYLASESETCINSCLNGHFHPWRSLFAIFKMQSCTQVFLMQPIESGPSRRGGVARVVTRGPGAFRGPERHIF